MPSSWLRKMPQKYNPIPTLAFRPFFGELHSVKEGKGYTWKGWKTRLPQVFTTIFLTKFFVFKVFFFKTFYSEKITCSQKSSKKSLISLLSFSLSGIFLPPHFLTIAKTKKNAKKWPPFFWCSLSAFILDKKKVIILGWTIVEANPQQS